jgi:hypothetical protein
MMTWTTMRVERFGESVAGRAIDSLGMHGLDNVYQLCRSRPAAIGDGIQISD